MTQKHSPDHSNHKLAIRNTVEKIVVNTGVGRLSQQGNFEEKILPQIKKDFAFLAGQVPQIRRVKKSIAGFKVREGQIVGLRATLRGKKMIDFFERFVNIVLPRVRDFRGIEGRAVDQGGGINFGIKEHVVFPEIKPEESPFIFSLGIHIVPRRKRREEMIENYRRLGVPLKKGKI